MSLKLDDLCARLIRQALYDIDLQILTNLKVRKEIQDSQTKKRRQLPK